MNRVRGNGDYGLTFLPEPQAGLAQDVAVGADRSAPAAAGLAGIVLAAGGAVRFGGAKQVARLDGVALVTRAAHQALACCPAGAVVVTGGYAPDVRAELAGLRITVVHNDDWRTGLASSIRRGVDALPASATACLVLLCDQPAVGTADLQPLVTAWAAQPLRAAAAGYAGTFGVPAIFPRALWPALRDLSGDCGARAVLAAQTEVTLVPLPGAALDVDTPADLEDLGKGQ